MWILTRKAKSLSREAFEGGVAALARRCAVASGIGFLFCSSDNGPGHYLFGGLWPLPTAYGKKLRDFVVFIIVFLFKK
jgi:hypothetical protein